MLDPDAPAPTIRGHMEIRQAPGAVAAPVSVDPRKEWDEGNYGGRPQAYGVQDWNRPASTVRGKQNLVNSRASVAHPGYPEPTHWLVRDEHGGLVLLGPEIKDWNEICYLVIMTEDEPGVWSWHRPMTDLELAVLQSLPAEHNGAMLALRGPSGKRREHIGNMLPKAVAKATSAYGTAEAWREDQYKVLGDACFAALKPGGHAIVNVDAPVREWRKGFGTERGFHAWRLMLDWAERVWFRVPDRLAFGRNGLPGAYGGRFRNDWEPLLWFQKPGADGYFDKASLDAPSPYGCGGRRSRWRHDGVAVEAVGASPRATARRPAIPRGLDAGRAVLLWRPCARHRSHLALLGR